MAYVVLVTWSAPQQGLSSHLPRQSVQLLQHVPRCSSRHELLGGSLRSSPPTATDRKQQINRFSWEVRPNARGSRGSGCEGQKTKKSRRSDWRLRSQCYLLSGQLTVGGGGFSGDQSWGTSQHGGKKFTSGLRIVSTRCGANHRCSKLWLFRIRFDGRLHAADDQARNWGGGSPS